MTPATLRVLDAHRARCLAALAQHFGYYERDV